MASGQRITQIATVIAPDDSMERAARARRHRLVNVPFVVVVAALVLYGLAVVYTATYGNEDYNFMRQLQGVAVGAVAMALVSRYNYHHLSHYMVFFAIINVVLILLPHIPLIGVSTKGATSWVTIGPVSFQPGEFAKITVILLAASVMARYDGRLDSQTEYLKCLGIMLIPFVCIMTQPDLGTGLVYLFISGVALVVGGTNIRYLAVTLGVILVVVAGVFLLDPVIDGLAGQDVLLKDYQRARLLVFMDNSYDPTGDGYNLQQAQIAIGSGGLFGKGFMNATQSTLGYLPEAPTDFIFCVLAEQFGFFGALLLLALYVLLLCMCFRIAFASTDLFGSVIVMCIAGMWLFQILENIGMTCGLMPITGIPLPFMSFGSSFMLVNFVLLGLVHSVWSHNGY